MLVAAFAALILQQTAPGVVWRTAPPDPVAAQLATASTTPTLPAWALADPFGWERSQCSSLVRREETLVACQGRVRTELATNLGGALPPALSPAGLGGECTPTMGEANDYAVTCGPERREGAPDAGLQEQVCETRPQRQGSGGVSWAETCRPASSPARENEGLTFQLGRDRD